MLGPGVVLEGEHDLDEGVVGAGAGGLEVFDEEFEGHVLVLVGGQAAVADVGQQVGEGVVVVGVGA
ncbi:hypothetical protein DE4576_05560 [Mycobacterium marinum]|nr:hypothetical protein DE4576_05560 [Mycobacterium marinum]